MLKRLGTGTIAALLTCNHDDDGIMVTIAAHDWLVMVGVSDMPELWRRGGQAVVLGKAI